MTRPQIDAVVFDIGNVLITWQPEVLYDRWIGEDRRHALFAEVDLHRMNDAVDRGAPFRASVETLAADHPDWADEIRMWHDRWLDMASPVIDRSVRLLRALRARGVPVFALSNFGVDTFAIAEGAYDFLSEFDQRFISGHLEVIKPDAEIYEILERDTGVAPDRLFFTDDRADNIAAAEARGWHGHLFTRPADLAERLVALGLLEPEQAI